MIFEWNQLYNYPIAPYKTRSPITTSVFRQKCLIWRSCRQRERKDLGVFAKWFNNEGMSGKKYIKVWGIRPTLNQNKVRKLVWIQSLIPCFESIV